MVQGSYTAVTKYNADGSIKSVDPKLALLAGKMITDVNEMITLLGLPNTITPDKGVLPSTINGIDPNFKMPQVWKSSIAADIKIPVSFPLTVTLEAIYNKTINGVMLQNWNLKQPDSTWQKFSGSDDRYIYPAAKDLTYTAKNAFVLANTNEGWGAIGNITVTAEPIKNLNVMVAYTKTESKEISGMPGSNASSAYSGLYEVNGPNVPWVQRSQYVVPNKAIASLSYRIPYLNNHMATTLGLFYSGYNYNTYSFTYKNDMNGDGYATDLIYIPKEKGDIKFATPADEEAFFKFMEQDKYLSAHKGEYAEANAVVAPWVNRFDLRFVQDFSIKAGKSTNTLQFSLDFLNFGNLINNTWGVSQNMAASNYGQILKYTGKDAGNIPTFSMEKDSKGNYLTKTFSTYSNYSQCWFLQLGVRYIFN